VLREILVSVFENILEALNGAGVEYELFEHKPVYTCEAAAKAVPLKPGEVGLKSMSLKAKNKLILVILPGEKRVDYKKIQALEGTSEVSMAKPEEVLAATGCAVGCVTPFGHLQAVKTYFDRKLLDYESVCFNPGRHDRTIKMRAKDLPNFLKNATAIEL
jgi:Ala-tRNA(Pro) deacylase